MHAHHILRSLYIVSPTTQLSSVEFEFPVLQRPCFESKFLERSTVTFHGLQITLNFNCSSFDGSTIMCFLTGKRCHKTINHRSFYCFTDYSVYCFSNLYSTAVLMISSFALRGPLFIFFSDRKRQNRQHLSLINEDQSFTLIETNYLVMNNFQSPWKNHIQLLTLNYFLFIVSRPVFCCLHAVV